MDILLQRLYKIVALLMIIGSVSFVVWYKYIRHMPRTDSRLVGTWVPDVDKTMIEISAHQDLNAEREKLWRDSLEHTEVKYSPHKAITTIRQSTQSIPYKVTSKKGDTIKVTLKDPSGIQIIPIHFESKNEQFWMPLAPGSAVRKYYRKSPDEDKKLIEDGKKPVFVVGNR